MRIFADQPRSKFLYIGVLLLGLLTAVAAIAMNRPANTLTNTENAVATTATTQDISNLDIEADPASELLWHQTLGSPVFEHANALILQSSGVILTAGSQYDPTNSASDSLIFRTLANGSLISVSTLEGDGEDALSALASMPDGTIYAVGQKGYTLSVARLLANGDAAWLKTYPLDGPSAANDLAITDTGDLLVAGATKSQGDGLLLRLDDKGNEIWKTTFPDGVAYAVSASANGGAIVGGQSSGQSILISLDRNGKEIWRVSKNEFLSDRIDALTVLSDGSILAAGVDITSDMTLDTYIARISEVGDILWQQRLGGSGDDQINAILPLSDGAILVGETTSTPGGNLDMWTLRLDMNGTEQWQQIFGGDKLDTAQDIVQAKDESLLLAGYTFSRGNGESDVWLIHMSIEGALPRELQSSSKLVVSDSIVTPGSVNEPVEEELPTVSDAPVIPLTELEEAEPEMVEIAESEALSETSTSETAPEPRIEVEPVIASEPETIIDNEPETALVEDFAIDQVTETVTFSCTFHCRTITSAHVPFPMQLELDLQAGTSLEEANALAGADTDLVCLGESGEADPKYSVPTCSSLP